MLSFAPDAIDIAPEQLSAVSGVPTIRGYASAPAGVPLDQATLAAASQGGAYLLGLNGSSRTIVGTSTKLYEAAGGAWNDVSRGTSYSIGASRWCFAQFGDTELAINKATQLQSSTTGAFADVANAPKASTMDVCEGFVVLGDCNDTSTGLSTAYGDQPHRWWISQSFNATGSWAPSVSTRATSGLLVATPGAITCIKRLQNYVIAYKANSIYIGRFTGPPAELTFEVASTDVGSPARDGVASVGSAHYFIGDSDIYLFDGARPQPIGALVKDWFFNRLNRAAISSIQSLHDKSAKRIYWFYPTVSTTLDSVLVYHYDTQRWGAFSLTITDVLNSVTDTITYDSLANLYSTYNDLPSISYDSPFWASSTPVLAYLDSANQLNSLSSSSGGLTMTTGWFGDESTVTVCTRVRPRYRTKPSAATIAGSTRMDLGGTISTGSSGSINGDRFDVLQSGRYHRFTLTLTGACEIEAVVPTLKPQGSE